MTIEIPGYFNLVLNTVYGQYTEIDSPIEGIDKEKGIVLLDLYRYQEPTKRQVLERITRSAQTLLEISKREVIDAERQYTTLEAALIEGLANFNLIEAIANEDQEKLKIIETNIPIFGEFEGQRNYVTVKHSIYQARFFEMYARTCHIPNTTIEFYDELASNSLQNTFGYGPTWVAHILQVDGKLVDKEEVKRALASRIQKSQIVNVGGRRFSLTQAEPVLDAVYAGLPNKESIEQLVKIDQNFVVDSIARKTIIDSKADLTPATNIIKLPKRGN